MISIKTNIPGRTSKRLLQKFQQLNGGWGKAAPFIHSGKGEGCYFSDVDGNWYLDFASQIASNPLGYNHPRLVRVLKKYKQTPIKYAGQDFMTREHLALLEELLSICKGMNAAFLINSGAEANENAIKIALRKKRTGKVGVSFESGFHGRTLGALSCTNAKKVQKAQYWTFPMHRLPFDNSMKEHFERLLEEDASAEDIGFVIVEPVQGEGGYNIAPEKMMKDLSLLCHKNNIPLIVDEVQTGMGRSGKWWAHEHYSFRPGIITSAKALQVAAVISKRSMFPKEPGSISSTWGGGHILDLALGVETIRIIKEKKLLAYNAQMGKYLLARLHELNVMHPRGLGLMCAFDLENTRVRDRFVQEAVKQGLVLLSCGHTSVRLIPPYIVTEKEIDEAVRVLALVLKKGRG